ncbi:SPRY domain-containing protein [Xylariales sp. AK1849]|nr:SPRY domain-containing protein [Xylariales sp. AK1849]
MCFGSKDNSSTPASKPAPMPRPASTSSYPLKANMNSSDYSPPSGPPPSHHHAGPSNDEYAAPAGPPPSKQSNDYAAPAGPPPSQDYAPPTGPPPSKRADEGYAPPLGPPPARDYAPPSGPPPSHEQPKKQAWEEAVPDTSLLPPPPNYFGSFERSSANNATEAEADNGERWCGEHKLFSPIRLDQQALQAIQVGNINLFTPPHFKGAVAQVGTGVWKGHSRPDASDTCIASYPPLYNVAAHSPLATQRKKTVYYEVNILKDSAHEVVLALGFSAPPYPAFRLPGWHRGSLAVHGDDGSKFINDRWGGRAFTTPFKRGETVGIGMDLSPGPGGGIFVEVFFTRDGREVGRWDLHEETDRIQDKPVTGLEGFHDLCASIGVYSKVSFEIVFDPSRWKWKGP